MSMRPMIGAILFCILAGCAHLRVDVDILDPVGVEETVSDAQLRRLYYQVLRDGPNAVRANVEQLKDRVDRAADALANVYDDLAKMAKGNNQVVLEVAANDIRKSTKPEGELYPAFANLENELVKANNAIISAAQASGPLFPGQAIPPRLREKLEQRRLADVQGRAGIEATFMEMKRQVPAVL